MRSEKNLNGTISARTPEGEIVEVTDIHILPTDSLEVISEKLRPIEDQVLLEYYAKTQKNLHFLARQRDNGRPKLAGKIQNGFTLLGFFRTEIEKRQLPLPPTMEELGL